MADAATSTRRAGRPRSSAHDGAILAAALHLLSRDGYPGMTLDGVAAEAGVSKATIYLRWRSKADLATAALAHLLPEPAGGLPANRSGAAAVQGGEEV